MAQQAQPSIHIRLPRTLHEQLREAAEQEEMSLNALLVALLAGGIGFTLGEPQPAQNPHLRPSGQLRNPRALDDDREDR